MASGRPIHRFADASADGHRPMGIGRWYHRFFPNHRPMVFTLKTTDFPKNGRKRSFGKHFKKVKKVKNGVRKTRYVRLDVIGLAMHVFTRIIMNLSESCNKLDMKIKIYY